MPLVKIGNKVYSSEALLDQWLLERPEKENGAGTVITVNKKALCPRCGWPASEERVKFDPANSRQRVPSLRVPLPVDEVVNE